MKFPRERAWYGCCFTSESMPRHLLNGADDSAFDSVYPAAIRLMSRRFWTPVAIARRAAEMFRVAGARRVLDAGSGVGKFVLSAAASAPALEFVGVEHRDYLVGVARRACSRLAIANARFHVGDVTEMDWSRFDGIYLFNPLAENLFERDDRIDDAVELGEERFAHDASRVESALKGCRLGTALVTYYGSSTRIPACFELETSERASADWLRLWIKRRQGDSGEYFIESDDGITLYRPGAAPLVNRSS